MVNYTPHAFMCVMRDYSSTELIVVLCDVSFTFWLYCAELPSRSVVTAFSFSFILDYVLATVLILAAN